MKMSRIPGRQGVQDVSSTFYTPNQGAAAARAAAPAVPPLSAACGYRYLISVPGG